MSLITGSKEHFDAQSATFMNWINVTIGRQALEGETIFEKLNDGVFLIKLLHSLVPSKRMPGRYDG
jgi:hypothetical protein